MRCGFASGDVVGAKGPLRIRRGFVSVGGGEEDAVGVEAVGVEAVEDSLGDKVEAVDDSLGDWVGAGFDLSFLGRRVGFGW